MREQLRRDHFEAFLALLFPAIHAQIDWSRGYESLDKEFQQVVREAEIGRRYVDKLVRVWTKAGKECWVLIHVEVQTDRDPDFASRMYVYNYRIFDRYNVPVASLAVLADDDPNWRPHEFRQALFDCEVGIRFPAVKLLDFVEYETELEASENPFAKIVLAHLKARQTQKDVVNRQTWKLRLVRGLYVRGFSAKDVRELFRLIDWLMVLPPPIEVLFRQDLDSLQKEKGMPYVTSIERVARRELLRKSIRIGLKIKFGDEGLKLMPEIENIHDGDLLDKILESLETAATLDDVRRFWADQPLQE
jgi:hypothetical protein